MKDHVTLSAPLRVNLSQRTPCPINVQQHSDIAIDRFSVSKKGGDCVVLSEEGATTLVCTFCVLNLGEGKYDDVKPE